MDFNFGQSHYSEGVQVKGIDIFFDKCISKFRLNHWGLSDRQQWRENRIALVKGEGEIRAMYQNEEGFTLHIIHFEVLNTKHTIFCTPKELEEGIYETVVKKVTKQHESGKAKRSKLNYTLFGA